MNWKCKALAGVATPTSNNEETAMSILTLAKRIAEEGPQAYRSVSKAVLYAEMVKRAEATRRAAETPETAFTRIATDTDDGRALFAAYKLALGEDYRPTSSTGVVSASPRSDARPIPPPNAAHDTLMRKAQALVAKVAKSGAGKRITLEAAYEKVLSDPANRALAQAAMRPASMQGAPTADEDEDEDDADSPASYEDDGGNTAHNPRSAVIGRVESDKEKTTRPTSAIRTFGLGERKAKVAARLQKFLTMCPNASDDEALGYALSRKKARKALEARLKAS
jgi:hypothetical protein